MAWFKVDDGLHASTKSRRAGDAMALWVIAGSWCAAQLTDGWLPQDMARVLSSNWKKQADRLVAAGLWEPAERDGHPGWVFHDWEVYQPTRAQVLADRKAAAERQQRAREKAKQSRRDKEGESHVSNGVTDGVTSPVSHGPPDPTRPDLKVKNSRPTAPRSADDDPEFVRFWTSYPRRVGKPAARKAWAKAIAAGHDPEGIIEAASQFTTLRGNEDPKFTPHPATWLNGERWNDEPDPEPQSAPGPVMPWELWD